MSAWWWGIPPIPLLPVGRVMRIGTRRQCGGECRRIPLARKLQIQDPLAREKSMQGRTAS